MAVTKFFQKFPKVPYSFGDGELPVNYQNLSVYIDAFEQLGEFDTYYQNYQIKDHERPDQISFELYGTTDFYWTFFLINEKIRRCGWPIDNSQVYNKAKQYYPNVAITTTGTSFNQETVTNKSMSRSLGFSSGKWVYFPVNKVAAKILRIDQNLATLYLDIKSIPAEESFVYAISENDAKAVNTSGFTNFSPTLTDEEYLERYDRTEIHRAYNQWDAIHHYEDADGNWVYPTYGDDPDYRFQWNSVSTYQSISYFQRMRDFNEELRSIKVLKKPVVLQVVTEFNQLLKLR